MNVAILSLICLIIWGIILLPENFKRKIIIEKKVFCDTLYLERNYELKDFCGQKSVGQNSKNNTLFFPNPRGAGIIEVKVTDANFWVYGTRKWNEEEGRYDDYRTIDCKSK